MVKVIGTPSCMKCKMTVRKMEQLGIEHTYLDVSEAPDLVAQAVSAGHTTAPLVFRGSEFLWNDFRPDRVAELAA